MTQRSPLPAETSVTNGDAIVTVYRAGERALPQRGSGGAGDRIAQLTAQLGRLLATPDRFDEPAFREAMEARAPASVKALANDLNDYADYCRSRRLIGLPASEARVVLYIENCEARGFKPATVARRLASLAAIHGFLGCTSPTRAASVRKALCGLQSRRGGPRRQAGPARLCEDGEASPSDKGTIFAAQIAACDRSPPGLRDAALLSLACDTGLRVSELAAIRLADIAVQDDGAAHLTVSQARTDHMGQGVQAWVSPETIRRIAAWVEEAGIHTGALFRRVAVRRSKARSGTQAGPIRELAWNYRGGTERLGVTGARPARVEYAIGEQALTPAAVRLIIKRSAQRAADLGLVPRA